MNCLSFRVGDVMLAVNDQTLNGKPISDVKSIIRSVPKGIVRFILKAGDVDEDEVVEKLAKKYSPSGEKPRPYDAISMASSMEDEKEDRLSTASFVAIPPDNSGKTTPSRPTAYQANPPPPPPPQGIEMYTGFVDDNMSDVASLPPAPPRPLFVSNKSLDTLPPAPPRPFVPQNVIASLGATHHQHLTSVKEVNILLCMKCHGKWVKTYDDNRTRLYLRRNQSNFEFSGRDRP